MPLKAGDMRIYTDLDIGDRVWLTCANRSRLDRLPGAYTADVCASSWRHGCPFLEDR